MGKLTYNHRDFDIEDRTLAHVQVLVSSKLRRHEPFVLGWVRPIETGGGRHMLWIENGVPIHFTYYGNRLAQINPQWVETMLIASAAAGGVSLEHEPAAERGHR